ncbi:hypothetical protein [Paracoccus jiaweipingae]|uniref:hypothetical protein n=1 Tax=unclassified Paracoccus (in: a-proteobacteria) TaxID=2688777 RepID=UPI0037AB7B94
MSVVSAWLVAATLSAPVSLDQWRADMTAHLLDGGRLPPDYRHVLMTMPPAQRFQAIVYLRRSGLLTGAAWAIEDLLQPANGGSHEE